MAINRCLDYFDALWSQGGRDLQPKDIDDWTTELTDHLASGARPRGPRALPDYGADAGLIEQPRIAALPLFTEARQAFVKFHGTSENRAPLSGTTLGELEGVGCHWALAYPAGKRPRIVRDGDLMFIASLTEAPPDIRVFGRAIAMRHEEGRDDATPVDIARLEWKERWPHYIRVHHAEFLNGKLANGVSLNELMDTLGPGSFASTQANLSRGVGNTDPRHAFPRQPAVRLSPQGRTWLNERLQAALDAHGTIPRSALDTLDTLDWPDRPEG